MKKFLLISILFVFIISVGMINSKFGNGVLAMDVNDNTINVFVNGEQITFDAPLEIINNRVIVPATKLYDALGATVEWRNDPGIMVASKNGIKVAVRIDNDSIVVNGQFVKVDATPRLINDKLFVPVRAVAEGLNAKVEWEETTKTVYITIENVLKDSLNFLKMEKDIAEIWKIEGKENFIVAMGQYISEKCEYGDKMENLDGEQRVFYITQALEMEVNNGGFSQFFFNSDGVFANELVSSFEKIGAMKTAEICKKAVSIFGDEIPTVRDEIQNILVPDDEKEEEKIENLLNECDDEFFEYEDDLLELSYQFIINNKESFSK